MFSMDSFPNGHMKKNAMDLGDVGVWCVRLTFLYICLRVTSIRCLRAVESSVSHMSVLMPPSSPPTRSSRWPCARCCRDRGNCIASRWQERSPPPRTHPWSPSRPACCPRPQPHPCRAAREAASLACRTMHCTSRGWVTPQVLWLHLYLSGITNHKGELLCNFWFVFFFQATGEKGGDKNGWSLFHPGAAYMKKLGVTAYWEDLWSMYMTSERLSFHRLSRTPSFMNVKQDGLLRQGEVVFMVWNIRGSSHRFLCRQLSESMY